MNFDVNDIIGKKFYWLTVKSYSHYEYNDVKKNYRHRYYYHCVCDCGNTLLVHRYDLLHKNKRVCGLQCESLLSKINDEFYGKTFGFLTVIGKPVRHISKTGKSRAMKVLCECVCGTKKDVLTRNLKLGRTISCGCKIKDTRYTRDISNQLFGNFVCIEPTPKRVNHNVIWVCKCDCGNMFEASINSIMVGDIVSCGCAKVSFAERCVAEYFVSKGFVEDIDFFREKTFSDLVGTGGGLLRFDFYFKSANIEFLLECHGAQHYKPVKWFGGKSYYKTLTDHDKIKEDYAKANSIKLVVIRCDRIHREDIFKELDKCFEK